ncbi:MAG TPA: hypothetical protein V6D20_02955 [Candidatus Obscuribacterales bacterium]
MITSKTSGRSLFLKEVLGGAIAIFDIDCGFSSSTTLIPWIESCYAAIAA